MFNRLRLSTMIFVIYNAYMILFTSIVGVGVLNLLPGATQNKGLLLIPLVLALLEIVILIYLVKGINKYKKSSWLPTLIILCLDLLTLIALQILEHRITGIMQFVAVIYLLITLWKERNLYTN